MADAPFWRYSRRSRIVWRVRCACIRPSRSRALTPWVSRACHRLRPGCAGFGDLPRRGDQGGGWCLRTARTGTHSRRGRRFGHEVVSTWRYRRHPCPHVTRRSGYTSLKPRFCRECWEGTMWCGGPTERLPRDRSRVPKDPCRSGWVVRTRHRDACGGSNREHSGADPEGDPRGGLRQWGYCECREHTC